MILVAFILMIFFEEYISFWPSVDMGSVGAGGKEAEQHNIM